MKHIFALLVISFLTGTIHAQVPTWEKQISCVVYSHCTSCHNPTGLAPFSLLTYSEAYAKRFAISNSVSNKKMPPYLPDLSYSRFAHERVLSTEEITLINAWVTAGAPAGDTTQAIQPPVYNTTEVITSPDLTARIETFTVPNVASDLYQAFIITNPAPTAQYITEVEVVPGNRNIVHHVLVFQDDSNTPVTNDSAYAGPGYVSFGGIGSSSAKLIAGWVPGAGVYTTPAGMGIRLEQGARIVVQIHYPIGSGGQVDSTKVNLKLSPSALRNVSVAPILNSSNLTNGPLVIQANTVKTFHAQYTVPANVTVISVAPHAHLICTKFEVFGVTPNSDTIRFIRINDWDFHWQGAQSFQKPIKVPNGTVLHSLAVYDNTANNPHHPNPSNPQLVTLGEATEDEMMLIYFGYLLYQNGDENVVVDTSSHQEHYEDCEPESFVSGILESESAAAIKVYPNPTEGRLTVQIHESLLGLTAVVYDVSGRITYQFYLSDRTNELNLMNLQSGIYFLRVKDQSLKFIRE